LSLRVLILVLFFGFARPFLGQQEIALTKNITTWGAPQGPNSANTKLLVDPQNNRIGNACLYGASRTELDALRIPDLEYRLDLLLREHTLAVGNGRYFLNIPVFAGERRSELNELVRVKSHKLLPTVSKMLDQIKLAVPGREDMAFHLLWSRVMDQAFCETWQLEQRPDACPPDIRYLIYPSHPFRFGTNMWGDELAVTWNSESICDVETWESNRIFLLKKAAGEESADPESIATLRSLGLFDSTGRFLGFSYRADDNLDKLLLHSRREYAHLFKDAYDYEGLRRNWDMPVEALWIALFHETAYSVLEELNKEKKFEVPAVFIQGGDRLSCKSAISLRIENTL
jgi:hypothetical protein